MKQEEETIREGNSSHSSSSWQTGPNQSQQQSSSSTTLMPFRAHKRKERAFSPIREGNSSQIVVGDHGMTFEIPTDTIRVAGREVPSEDLRSPEQIRINREWWKTTKDREMWFAKLQPEAGKEHVKRRHALLNPALPPVHCCVSLIEQQLEGPNLFRNRLVVISVPTRPEAPIAQRCLFFCSCD